MVVGVGSGTAATVIIGISLILSPGQVSQSLRKNDSTLYGDCTAMLLRHSAQVLLFKLP
ncbi:MAG: hypothetical protein ACLT9P_02090 [Evtepia gabavorous]